MEEAESRLTTPYSNQGRAAELGRDTPTASEKVKAGFGLGCCCLCVSEMSANEQLGGIVYSRLQDPMPASARASSTTDEDSITASSCSRKVSQHRRETVKKKKFPCRLVCFFVVPWGSAQKRHPLSLQTVRVRILLRLFLFGSG